MLRILKHSGIKYHLDEISWEILFVESIIQWENKNIGWYKV